MKNGFAFKSEEYVSEGLRVIRIKNVQRGHVVDDDPKFMATKRADEFSDYLLKAGDILMSLTGNVGRVGRLERAREPALLNQRVAQIEILDRDRLSEDFLFALLNTDKFESHAIQSATGVAQANLSSKWVADYKIPLPPLEVQQEIVAEIEGYQKVIDGARAVLDHYRPHIPIHPDWPISDLGDLCTIVRGSSPRPQGDSRYFGGPVPRLMVADITRDGMYSTPKIDSLTEEGATKSRPMQKGDVIITVSGNPGLPTILAIDACIHDGFVGLRELKREQVTPEFLYYYLVASHAHHGSQSVGTVFKNLTTDQIREFKIPLPPLATQQQIVSEIESEQRLVAANRELIARFEQKIATTLARIWGEEPSAPAP